MKKSVSELSKMLREKWEARDKAEAPAKVEKVLKARHEKAQLLQKNLNA